MNWEIIEENAGLAKIKVIGVGGAGGNAVIHMINHEIQGADFICANTDSQALDRAKGSTILKLGDNVTRGLGAGADPQVGRAAAERDRAAIEELLAGADMIFITAGMGGGTGTGAAPVIAEIAKELGALTVAVVTKPFNFEGHKRKAAAEQGIAELVEEVDSLITIPNQKLMDILGRKTSMEEAFAKADDILKGAVQGISDIIMKPGYINVDFADVKTVMSEKGIAMMGTGQSSADERGIDAASQAVSSELLEDIELKDARGILVNITAKSPTMADFDEVDSVIRDFTADDATIIYGTVMEDSMDDEELLVTVVATGVNQKTATLAVDNSRRATVQLNPVGLDAPKIDQTVESGGTSSAEDIDFLDVPTFMRKQVD
ncbi:cell division protein FtsZ [Pseudomonadota bacterium]|uniref:Cell division protein FtsZ n=1 Tax=SAR86 cluster bacterium TaxID=2030880 RepID=A0A520LTK8_9GAMM|nr:cell division protein FtsZ [Pseudomonadota bacterium]MDC0244375.1 cell division protein FtsZ [Pseudomonadota bacterium]RZO12294.1 MAG: cell division protein FtsZ [SAR86 cluster bacterium]|tara:strand:+ start:381 stop:1508 length:1128 start_codon:yes stop_codon:yes gene_type:complete